MDGRLSRLAVFSLVIGYFQRACSELKGGEMPLMPADVRNKHFSTTRLRPGYDEEEVDAFLDEIEAELDRLIQENEELRGKLAESLRGGGRQALPVFSSPMSDSRPPMPLTAPVLPEQERQPPASARANAEGRVDADAGVHHAAHVLSLAQTVADQAVAEARREADEALGRARLQADEILASARSQAEQITGDARAHAESLERDAQERHRQAMGSLVGQREELERRVDDLRTYEREFRARLAAYLDGRLRDLEAGADGSGAPPGPAPGRPAIAAGALTLEPTDGEPSRIS
jgi:DivIVA domain-containing protein